MTNIAITKVMQLCDEALDLWYDTYEAPGVEGLPVRASLLREVQSPLAVLKALRNAGADLANTNTVLEAIEGAIAEPAPIVRRAHRVGWRNDNRMYVTHYGVIGDSGDTTIIPPVRTAAATALLTQQGTLDGWRGLVEVAVNSTVLTTALCAPFAATILAPLGRQSYGLVFVGPSRCGKSTAQLAAGSAIGFGTEEAMPTFNATSAGLLETAMACNDSMLPLNELGTTRGAKRDIYPATRSFTYALTSGQDVQRHSSWTGGGKPTTFRTILLVSSERSPDEWADCSGDVRDDGETARLIGLPVLLNGSVTIFDLAAALMTPDEERCWADKQFAILRNGLPQHCGVALTRFLEVFVKHRDDFIVRAQTASRSFEQRVGRPNMSAIERDIVAKFGLLAAGGVLAIRAGVLPLRPPFILETLSTACHAALGALPRPQDELGEDIATLRTRLEGASIIDTDVCSKRDLGFMRNADGYCQAEGGGRRYVIRAQLFTGWFRTEGRLRRLLAWLDDEGFLQHKRERASGRSTEWAQTQVIWPDGTRVRSFCLFLPRGLIDLDHVA